MSESDYSPYTRIRALLADAEGGEIEPSDFVVVHSLLADISEPEISAVLDEYFDIEPLIMTLFERFRDRKSEWSKPVRQKLLEALVFCGYEEEAEYLLSIHDTSESD